MKKEIIKINRNERFVLSTIAIKYHINKGYILGMSVNKGALVKLFPNSNFKHVSFTNNSILRHNDLINI